MGSASWAGPKHGTVGSVGHDTARVSALCLGPHQAEQASTAHTVSWWARHGTAWQHGRRGGDQGGRMWLTQRRCGSAGAEEPADVEKEWWLS